MRPRLIKGGGQRGEIQVQTDRLIDARHAARLERFLNWQYGEFIEQWERDTNAFVRASKESFDRAGLPERPINWPPFPWDIP